jgi:hypothetical protein
MRTPVLGALAAAVLLAAGCGFANPFAPSGAAANSNARDLALEWAQCMRQHGVDVSDPNSSGGVRIKLDPGGSSGNGGSGGSGSESGVASGASGNGAGGGPPPEVQAAMDACQQYAPSGGRSSGPPSQQQVDAAVRLAQCMRDQGIPMQDPQVSNDGLQIKTSPGAAVDPSQFQQAQQACRRYRAQASGSGS